MGWNMEMNEHARYDESGMGDRAREAYSEGKFTLSDLCKQDIEEWGHSVKMAKWLIAQEFLLPCEWHHKGDNFKKVNFYDPQELMNKWDRIGAEGREKWLQEFASYQKSQKEKNLEEKNRNYRVSGYYIYSGKGRYGYYTKKILFTGDLKGKWIYTDSGEKKKASGENIFWEKIEK